MDRYGSNFGFIYILLLSFLCSFFFSFLSSCSSRPLETLKLFDILKSPDPLDYSLDWHYGTGRTYPIECVGSSCPALSNYLVCLVRVYFNFQRALMKVYVAKNVPLIIIIIMPMDRPLHDTQQEQI